MSTDVPATESSKESNGLLPEPGQIDEGTPREVDDIEDDLDEEAKEGEPDELANEEQADIEADLEED